MTDAEIEELLIGRTRQELVDQWGEPQSTDEAKNQDIFLLNPEHVPDGSHMAIIVCYDDNSTVGKVSIDYCN